MRILTAPVPGTIRDVKVRPKDRVVRGQVLLSIEVMQMIEQVPSTVDGTVVLVYVHEGEEIRPGSLLVELGS